MPKADRELTEQRQCKVCGKQIISRYPRVRYCSPSCWYSTQRKAVQTPLRFGHRKGGPQKCKTCGKEYWPSPSRRRKYCSFKCSIEPSRRQVSVTCSQCGIEFTRGQSFVKRTKNQFCTLECSRAFYRGEKSINWRGGQPRHYRGPDWPQRSKEARARDNHTCQVCGKPQQKGQKLSVDHIIPYRIVKENALVNLISICRAPCHAIKTQGAERKFLRGDILGFLEGLRTNSWPMERVEAAIKYWGKL